MGFNKKRYSPEISITVTHSWYPGEEFTFHLSKKLSQEARDAQSQYFALNDEERPEAYRQALVNIISKMVARPPEGFDDFIVPTGFASQEEQLNALRDAVRDYFDDPLQADLEQILKSVWGVYLATAMPVAYLKSGADSDASLGQLPALPETA
jgi:hypothetical protein